AFNWLAGLACVLLLWGFLRAAGVAPVLAAVVAGGMLFAQAFLNYAQTGSAYVPGLAFVLLALYLGLACGERSWPASIGAGLALAASICFWFPYVLAVPAVLVTPVVLGPATRPRLWFVVRAAAVAGFSLTVAYGVPAWLMDLA